MHVMAMLALSAFEDELDYYTFHHDKHMFSGRSGKQRSKREVAVRSNRPDPSGHSRKIVTKVRNTERNQRKKVRDCQRRAERTSDSKDYAKELLSSNVNVKWAKNRPNQLAEDGKSTQMWRQHLQQNQNLDSLRAILSF